MEKNLNWAPELLDLLHRLIRFLPSVFVFFLAPLVHRGF